MRILLNNPYLVLSLALGLLNLVLLSILFWRFETLQRKQKELFEFGEDKQNLFDQVLKHKKTLGNHGKNLLELGNILEELVEKNKLNIHKVGVVRFNPFRDTGGNMSFALALLDGQDSGIVISSLHGREGTRIYAKNLEKGESTHKLTEEEKEAISLAKGRI